MSTGAIGPQSLASLLAQVSFEVIGRLNRVSAEEDMSLTQLRMLAILRDRHLRMAQLASALGTDRSSVSGLINRAEQRGLVTREPAVDDKRGLTVSLSPDGQAFAVRVQARTEATLEPLLGHLLPQERDAFAAALIRSIEPHDSLADNTSIEAARDDRTNSPGDTI